MELKNCPFCGSEAHLHKIGNYAFVRCGNNKCKVRPMTEGYIDNDRAIREWNRRDNGKAAEQDEGT